MNAVRPVGWAAAKKMERRATSCTFGSKGANTPRPLLGNLRRVPVVSQFARCTLSLGFPHLHKQSLAPDCASCGGLQSKYLMVKSAGKPNKFASSVRSR